MTVAATQKNRALRMDRDAKLKGAAIAKNLLREQAGKPSRGAARRARRLAELS